MRVHHIAFRTTDLARLEAFYVGVLGLAVTKRSEQSVWLDADGAIVMLELADRGEPLVQAKTMELVAFSIDTRDRDACEQRLAASGVVVEARTDFTLYCRDPDGRRVGLSHYARP